MSETLEQAFDIRYADAAPDGRSRKCLAVFSCCYPINIWCAHRAFLRVVRCAVARSFALASKPTSSFRSRRSSRPCVGGPSRPPRSRHLPATVQNQGGIPMTFQRAFLPPFCVLALGASSCAIVLDPGDAPAPRGSGGAAGRRSLQRRDPMRRRGALLRWSLRRRDHRQRQLRSLRRSLPGGDHLRRGSLRLRRCLLRLGRWCLTTLGSPRRGTSPCASRSMASRSPPSGITKRVMRPRAPVGSWRGGSSVSWAR